MQGKGTDGKSAYEDIIRQELKTDWMLEVAGEGEEGDGDDAWFGVGTKWG